MDTQRSELELACKLIRLLDGLPIEKARDALIHAQTLILSTQIVKTDSPLLTVTAENEKTFSSG